MRGTLLSFVVVCALVACGDDPPGGVDQCANVVPPPAACMTMCDPSPGAAASCPGGFHCTPDGTCNAFCTAGGEECGDGYRCTPDGRCVGNDECIGLECNIVDCDGMGMPLTTISGTVFAPNGTLPLFGINVYVPNQAIADPVEGAICDRCTDSIPGFPLSKASTDESGRFTLINVPSGQNVPVIISSGKWRRTIMVSTVAQCADTPLPAADTRLPKNKSEGFMPKIAITTGNADSLECLIRKLGIDDAEISSNAGTGRIHMYSGNGVNQFSANHAGGTGAIPSATPFWSDVNNLKPYDIVFLSCEGQQNGDTKPQPALDAMKAYADLGGRVFASHWHNIWIGGDWTDGNGQTPAVWSEIADWVTDNGTNLSNATDTIDEVNNPKGTSFATWMLNVMGSTVRGQISVTDPRITALGVDTTKAERWVYLNNGGAERPQTFQFTTPNEAPLNDRCGKVVFTDMHVTGTSPGGSYPMQSCANAGTTLTPQEKALAFMFFDLASCVASPIF
ncbi:MAG: carboxypeptidase regulatory-like domain-containing protein [Kofleriaceae bacterium]